MPLTEKGRKIERVLTKEYGAKHGREVLYAGKNSGRFTGIDSASPAKAALAAGKREAAALQVGNPKAALKANRQETKAEKALAKLQGHGNPIKGTDLARRQQR